MQNKTLTIVVGSTNPVKIESTKQSFKPFFPDHDLQIIAFKAASGVPDQPIGEEETLQGAINRAHHCRKAHPDADYFVGLEGGATLMHDTKEMLGYAWIAILNQEGKLGRARTGSYYNPKPFYQLVVEEGMEIGHACEKVFKKNNSKQKMGTSGIITHGVIERVEMYRHGVVYALAPFLNPEHY